MQRRRRDDEERRKLMDDIRKDPFEEYIKNLPPSKKEIGSAWSAAIGP